MDLETVRKIQHSVGTEDVILLRVLRELIDAHVVQRTIVLHGIVASALLVAAGHDLLVVQDVGHHEVDREGAALLQAKASADRAVEHESALALRLLGHNVVAIVVDVAHRGERSLIAHAGRVGEVDAVVVITVQVDEPAALVVAQSEASCREWRAGLAHAFVHDDIVGVGAPCGTHVAHVGIVDVLGLAPGADGFQVEERGESEVQSQFHTIVFFLDAGHRDIGERVDVVEIEVLPFGDMVQSAVVGIQTGMQP